MMNVNYRGRHADEAGVADEALLADAGAAQGVAAGEEAAAALLAIGHGLIS